MVMAGMNHSFYAKQLGPSVEMFQRTYSKWIDGQQDDAQLGAWKQLYTQANPRNRSRPRKALIYMKNYGVADGARTHDNRNHNPGLYQLSYSHHRVNIIA